jgi:hypothetical protein
MAKNASKTKGRAWKNERASVSKKNKTRAQSNKYSSSDKGRRPKAGSADQYWRAGYTRKDGTKVKGHYVKRPSLIDKIKDVVDNIL